jgi:hypothetical protein
MGITVEQNTFVRPPFDTPYKFAPEEVNCKSSLKSEITKAKV